MVVECYDPSACFEHGVGFKYGDVITIPNSITGHSSAATRSLPDSPAGKSNGDAGINVRVCSRKSPRCGLEFCSQLDVLNVSNSLKMLQQLTEP